MMEGNDATLKQRHIEVDGFCGGCRGGWRLRHGDGGREGKLGLGFWFCEGERVMRCHSMRLF